ncbi:QCR7 (YDR529C) [Zygosaccharomyces parabailii]|uniref:Cytochrome b-c1 complex subunit 7 n=1 Tax=Zygosaccharomyces bailii (strain CLIB 213 / ATCC 58445 / CBS 680 / BCRC 21525 / NBRC 1098 / NCYC 1416 / NRRL Y-2227) TaxID=1333698 RepID=A0A8J2TC48_ZYGB2|nr:QCR7 (YDR529C) [Zygosaccharomyces parabailii]CDF91844.1 ZYBA0S14-02476g1_1 [Zygosaccharomyces bailii CLIB 213]CDH09836.1 QCR7-Ubiquinol--cytochrome-c reductase subunit 7 [Zygosaccharomyces bailii ISA1307]SJM88151.1 Cytochrome b-c1 complex subunit 7 [Zygosaccharomyces bailii]AQZ18899.1 QCR7 (YDR529C) [Zygosaccharomyces parabailii]
MPQSFTSIVKIGDYILNSPVLSKILVPVARQYVNLSGYRKLGLRFDDLIAEENPVMQKALKRLPEDESYARVFRIIRAHQTELTHHLLPESQWIKPKEDVPFLLPYILEVEAANKEKEELDNLEVSK